MNIITQEELYAAQETLEKIISNIEVKEPSARKTIRELRKALDNISVPCEDLNYSKGSTNGLSR